MVRGALRSHSMARLRRRLPGNNNGVIYRRRKPKAKTCPITGMRLNGVPRVRPAALQRIPKSARRPSRPYGGQYSHKAVANAIWEQVLAEETKE